MDQTIRATHVAMVDLDTSHPEAWLPILRKMGYQVSAVFDGGAVYPAGYASQFATQHGIPMVFDSVEAMAASDAVDIAMVHSCNWDLHVPRMRPFIDAGKAVLVNKPLAGSVADLYQIRAWARAGARISGGSSLRACLEVQGQQEYARAHGPARALFVGCGVDAFNYGVHAWSMAAGLFGPGIMRVRHLGISSQQLHHIEAEWQDERRAALVYGGGYWLPFHATVIYQDTVQQIQAQMDTVYQAFLQRLMPYLSGAVDMPPFPVEALIEPELAAIAANISLQRDGEWVMLATLSAGQPGFDGQAFGEQYRAEALGHHA